MIRVAIAGAAGRMGRTLVQAVAEADDLVLTAASEAPGSPMLGVDAGECAGIGPVGVRLVDTLTTVVADFDTLIDFTLPRATLPALDVCADAGRSLVIGTTGFDAAGLGRIRQAAERVPILMAPNMSIGVNLLFQLVADAARILGDSVDVEILDLHHGTKIDAPSGTAVRLGEVLAEVLGRDLGAVAEYGRVGETGPRRRESIGVHVLRAGDVVGEHSVLFAGAGERLEITHRAASRENFAQGALRAVRFLAGRGPGLFSMQDVLFGASPQGADPEA